MHELLAMIVERCVTQELPACPKFLAWTLLGLFRGADPKPPYEYCNYYTVPSVVIPDGAGNLATVQVEHVSTNLPFIALAEGDKIKYACLDLVKNLEPSNTVHANSFLQTYVWNH